jgi:hypothetical protein
MQDITSLATITDTDPTQPTLLRSKIIPGIIRARRLLQEAGFLALAILERLLEVEPCTMP